MVEIQKMVTIGLLTSLILGIGIVLALNQFGEAYGETLILHGTSEDHSIMIADDRTDSYVEFDGVKHYDFRMKYFASGGFLMINPEIVVFAHPQNNDEYKLTIFTEKEVYKMIAGIKTLHEFEDTIESKSPVGADISKWDIPTEGRTDHMSPSKPENVHDPDSLDIIFSVPKSVKWMNNLNFDFTAIDTQIVSNKDQRLSNVDVYTTITNPIGEIVGTWNGTTGGFGTFGDKYYIVDNQMLGKYTFEVSAEKEDYNLITKTISFFVLSLSDNSKSPECPTDYFYNYSTPRCQEECTSGYFYNYTSIMCQEECIPDYFYNYTSIQCEINP